METLATEVPATVYFNRSNNLVSIEISSNPRMEFTVSTDLEENVPSGTSSGETSTAGGGREISGVLLRLRQWKTAPGTVEKFTVSSDISGTNIKIGRGLGQSALSGFTAQITLNNFVASSQQGEGTWSELEAE
ncbi:hypothetical protein FRC08_003716 [Ceratobasidium sp. 394]|nr:hypothetical protein FRC08_003716 [Ceratobasidium sp. 394]